MKQVIVLVASIILGITLVTLIIGPQDSSTFSVLKQGWNKELSYRTLKGAE